MDAEEADSNRPRLDCGPPGVSHAPPQGLSVAQILSYSLTVH